MTKPPRIDDVIDYLRTHGWALSGHWRNATVWSLREFDVLVPPSDTIADASGRLRELVRCVADAEGRSPRVVGRDIALPGVDVVSYRAGDAEDTITLPSGIRSLRAARDLVAICAREVEAGPALMERSLLSLSEEVFGVDIALPYEDPLGRRTALRVLRSSTVVLRAVSSPDVDAFDHAFRDGVSEEVCSALADLAGADNRSPFELGFRWSRRDPLANEAVEFPRGAGERIRTAVKRAPPADAVGVVEGPVTGLADDLDGERWRIRVRGVLHVDGTATGRKRLVSVRLGNAQDYEAALAAHQRGKIVRAEGKLTTARGITAVDNGFTMTDRTRDFEG